MSTLVIAPHCDDAAFSLGGSFVDHAAVLGPITALVIFSTSDFTLGGRRPSAEVTALRHAEEEAAAARLGYSAVFAGFEEALVRGAASDLRGAFDRRVDPRKDPSFGAVKQRVLAEIALGAARVIGPAGIGGHLDHRLLRCVMDDIALQGGATACALYEDLPYIAQIQRERRRRVREALLGPLTPWKAPGRAIEAKIAALREHRSQVSSEHLGTVRHHHGFVGGEHLWTYRPEAPWPGCRSVVMGAARDRSSRGAPSTPPGAPPRRP